MADEKAPLQVNGKRQQQVEQLFQRTYAELLGLALSGNQLFVADGENIVQGLAQHLLDYDGPLDDSSFLDWAASIIKPAINRLVQWYSMRQQYGHVVFKSLWQVMLKAEDLSGGDPAGTVRDLANQTWLWAFENLDDLAAKPKAISTRLYAKAHWTGRAWKTAQLRERDKKADFDVALLDNDKSLGVDDDEDEHSPWIRWEVLASAHQ